MPVVEARGSSQRLLSSRKRRESSLNYIPSFETTKLYFTFPYLYQILEAIASDVLFA
jgi:hypothetical protein